MARRSFRTGSPTARLNAIVLGPGGGVGAPMRDMVLAALAGERAVVLDADALTSFADDAGRAVRRDPGAGSVADRADPARGRVRAIVQLGSRKILKYHRNSNERAPRGGASGAIVLLKGSDTVVAAPDGRASITENAPPWLATAGSGDVLAGFVAGLLAQGMPAFEAASAATWLHGEAGSEAGPGLIAEDLPEALRVVYRRLFVDLGAWP